MTECHCQISPHPSGDAWVAMTPDRTCPHHRHGQPWRDETRGDA